MISSVIQYEFYLYFDFCSFVLLLWSSFNVHIKNRLISSQIKKLVSTLKLFDCFYILLSMPTVEKLIPLTYSAPAPPTGEKCTDPTPDEQYALLRAELHAVTNPGEVPTGTVEAEAPPAGSQGSAGIVQTLSQQMGQMKEMANKVIRNAQKNLSAISTEAEAQLRDLQIKMSAKVFKMAFQELADSGEVFIASFPCSAIHSQRVVDGTVIITRNYICFSSSSANVFNSAKDAVVTRIDVGVPPSTVIAAVIPLNKVVSIVPSLALDTKEGPPFFMDIPSPHVLSSAIEVYDSDNNRFQFFNFNGIGPKMESILYQHIKGRPVEFAYNYMDHAWREIVTPQ